MPRRPLRVGEPSTFRNEVEVVDLTSDDPNLEESVAWHEPAQSIGNAGRGPRFPNQIIHTELHDREGDLQFISSHSLIPPNAPIPESDIRTTSSRMDDGLQYLGQRQRNPPPPPPPPPPLIPLLTHSMDMEVPELNNTLRHFSAALTDVIGSAMGRLSNMPFGLITPDMDYTAVGFAYRHDSSPPPQASSHPPLEPAPRGFTRDPKENETYVCPNCDEELCEGEDEIKQQVWVVKGCGHVYCGECAKNRFVGKAKKAKPAPRTKPFKTCVVEGCNAKTSSHKALTQLFI